jgi:hypothetical protein
MSRMKGIDQMKDPDEKFRRAFAELCKAERTLSNNAAKRNPELESDFRAAALACVAAYRAASEAPFGNGNVALYFEREDA